MLGNGQEGSQGVVVIGYHCGGDKVRWRELTGVGVCFFFLFRPLVV